MFADTATKRRAEMTKAQMFTTAIIRADLPKGYQLLNGLHAGQCVSIKWYCDAWNAQTQRQESVYSVSATTDHTNALTMYENAFSEFVL